MSKGVWNSTLGYHGCVFKWGRDAKVFPEKAHSGRGRIMGSWCDRERKSGNFRCRIKNVGWHFQENAGSPICQSQTTSLEENRRVLIFLNCDRIIYGWKKHSMQIKTEIYFLFVIFSLVENGNTSFATQSRPMKIKCYGEIVVEKRNVWIDIIRVRLLIIQ